MPIFKYKASFKDGKITEGEKSFDSRDEVVRYLHEQGLIVISVEEKIGFNLKKFGEMQIGNISLKERLFFVKQMGAMLGAGLPVIQALEIIIDQTKTSSVQSKLTEVYKDVKSGLTLAASFGKQKVIFDELQLSLLKAGEQSGNLVEIIKQIATDMQKKHQLQGRIKGALIYPIIILLTAVVVIIILVVYMIPAVKDLYLDLGATEDQIPAITRFLVTLSQFFTNPLGVGVTIIGLVTIFFTYKSFYLSVIGRKIMDKFFLRMPIFGDLVSKTLVLEMCRLLSMLIKSGISIIDALKSTAASLKNVHYKNALLDAADKVAKGNTLSAPLAASKIIPIMVVKMIATGEETGTLDSILADLANFYEDEVEELTSNLTKLMEPLMLLIVGLLVGFLAVAVYLPIYSVANLV